MADIYGDCDVIWWILEGLGKVQLLEHSKLSQIYAALAEMLLFGSYFTDTSLSLALSLFFSLESTMIKVDDVLILVRLVKYLTLVGM